MKNLLLSAVFILIPLLVNSQPCQKPMAEAVFAREMNRLKTTQPERKKLEVAIDMTRRSCLLSTQAGQVAKLFVSDDARLEYAKAAYLSIYDQENVYDLYDMFALLSTAMRFHDYVEKLGEHDRADRYSDQDRPYSFPDYNYPSYQDYHDKAPCNRPISDETFNRLIKDIVRYRDDDARMDAAVKFAESNCLSVEQIMKLGSVIEKEPKRLDYMKRTYDYAYDATNYRYGNQLFKDNNNVNEFDNFVRERRGGNRINDRDKKDDRNICMVSDAEMNDIVMAARDQSFDNKKLDMLKQIVTAKKCFRVAQIKQMVEMLTYETNKVDLAKYCYAFCTDRSDYYKINSSFSFSRSSDELNKFIQEQH
jgi:hypothetical protein